MGRRKRMGGWRWCAIGLALIGCRAIEERGLGGAVPAADPAGDEEPSRPARPGPISEDAGAPARPDWPEASAPAPDATAGGTPVSPPGEVAADAATPAVVPDAAPDPVDAAGVPAAPIDAAVGVPPAVVAQERPACLAMIECGTQAGAANRLAYTHAIAAGGSNRYLVVAAAVAASGRTVQASYGGAVMEAIGSVANQAGTCQVSLFGLAGPAPGSRAVVVTVSGAPLGIVLSAATFTNVDQTSPYRPGGYRSAAGAGPEVRASAPSGPGEMTVDAACVTGGVGLNVFAPPGPSVEVFDALIAPGKEAVQSARPAGSDATTMSYHAGGAGLDWATGVVSLRPAAPVPGL
jgi:hypothetical protein